MKKTLIVIIAMLFAISVNATTKTVHVVPENARIFVNGVEVGSGSHPIKFARGEDFVVLRFEAPGFITRSFRLQRNDPRRTIQYTLFEDEALRNSFGAEGASMIANSFFSLTVRDGMTTDEIWRRLMNIAVRNFENIEVRDQAAGWIRSAWVNTTFSHQIVRTRLEIQSEFLGEGKLAYRVRVSSEIADRECGTNPQCFVTYDRVLRRFEDLINELRVALGSDL